MLVFEPSGCGFESRCSHFDRDNFLHDKFPSCLSVDVLIFILIHHSRMWLKLQSSAQWFETYLISIFFLNKHIFRLHSDISNVQTFFTFGRRNHKFQYFGALHHMLCQASEVATMFSDSCQRVDQNLIKSCRDRIIAPIRVSPENSHRFIRINFSK